MYSPLTNFSSRQTSAISAISLSSRSLKIATFLSSELMSVMRLRRKQTDRVGSKAYGARSARASAQLSYAHVPASSRAEQIAEPSLVVETRARGGIRGIGGDGGARGTHRRC